MLWRLRKTSNGIKLSRGLGNPNSVANPNGPGYIMPHFIEYEFHMFRTEKQAMKFAEKHRRKDDVFEWESIVSNRSM